MTRESLTKEHALCDGSFRMTSGEVMGTQKSTCDVSAAFPFPLLHCYLVLLPTFLWAGGRATTTPEAKPFASLQSALVWLRSVSPQGLSSGAPIAGTLKRNMLLPSGRIPSSRGACFHLLYPVMLRSWKTSLSLGTFLTGYLSSGRLFCPLILCCLHPKAGSSSRHWHLH